MKKQLTLAITFSTVILQGCIDLPGVPTFTSEVSLHQTPRPIYITSIYPKSGLSGSEMAICGENFGSTISENYITFNYPDSDKKETGWASEIIQVPHAGIVLLRVPLDLNPGEYAISLHAKGQSSISPQTFTVLDPTAKN